MVNHPPEQPTLEELQQRHGTTDGDELILRALLPETALTEMRAAGPVRQDFPLASPQVEEIRTLLKTARSPYLRVITETMDLEVRRS